LQLSAILTIEVTLHFIDNLHIPIFLFLFNEPKAPALWTTLTFWILNISLAITAGTDYHAILFGIENLLLHFSPPDKLSAVLFLLFPQ
jgi:hypothetical protein